MESAESLKNESHYTFNERVRIRSQEMVWGLRGDVSIDEIQTDALLVEAVARIQRLEAALKRLRDCDWVITPHEEQLERTIAEQSKIIANYQP